MYHVTCPHCQRQLSLKREVDRAKMKCRFCGAIFVGSTKASASPASEPVKVAPVQDKPPVTAEPLEVAPAQNEPPVTAAPEVAPRPRQEPAVPRTAAQGASRPPLKPQPTAPARPAASGTSRRAVGPRPIHAKNSALPIVGVIAGLLAIAVVIIAVVLHSKRSETPPASDQKSADAQAAGSDNTAEAAVERTPPPLTPTEDEPPIYENETPAERSLPPRPEGTAVQVISFERLPEHAGASNTFCGTFANNSDTTLRVVYFYTVLEAPGGARMTLRSNTGLQYIPPNYNGSFSIRAKTPLPDGVKILDTYGIGTPAEEKLVGWPLAFRRGLADDGQVIEITGTAVNRRNTPLMDVMVWCDFYSLSGEYVGSAKGSLRRNATSLDAAGTGGDQHRYTITFDPAGTNSPLPSMIGDVQPRLLGRLP
jgi:hypothetical protein